MSDPPSHRVIVPELDKVLGRKWSVLGDGYVRVVDYMGSDEAIAQAARVSYGQGTRAVHQDAGLIRYLMRHRHTTPFEMCEIKLHVRVPMDTWRQWIRHRTANVNEYSTRYSVAIDSAATTGPEDWRTQSQSNKQGSESVLPVGTGSELSRRESDLHRLAREVYEERLRAGVAREQARKDLPLSTYTEAFWKIDLHNLFNFLELRMAPAAQVEIRRYAEIIGNEVVSRWCPIAWSAFVDYRLNALALSKPEVEIIRHLQAGDQDAARATALSLGWLEATSEGLVANRERRELEEKLARLGMTRPW